MSSGVPLTDEDRWSWLVALKNEAVHCLGSSDSVVIACSALKRRYRDILRQASQEQDMIRVHFVFLTLDEKLLRNRIMKRTGHYMKEDMIESQLLALEMPDAKEVDVIHVDSGKGLTQVQKHALLQLETRLLALV